MNVSSYILSLESRGKSGNNTKSVTLYIRFLTFYVLLYRLHGTKASFGVILYSYLIIPLH
jgi:hypothetical protein